MELKYKINKNLFLLDIYSLVLYGILGLVFIILTIIIIIKICCPHALKCKKSKKEHHRIPLSLRQVTSDRNGNIVISQREARKEIKKKVNFESLKVLKHSIYEENLIQKYDSKCTICFEPFILGKTKISITPCEHISHMECIKKWIESNGVNPFCPNCKYCFIKNKDEINKYCFIKNKDEINSPSLMIIRKDPNHINNLGTNTNRNLENNENNNSHLTV